MTDPINCRSDQSRHISTSAGNDADGGHHDTARRDRDSAPTDGTLEVQVGGEWHPVDLEGDMA